MAHVIEGFHEAVHNSNGLFALCEIWLLGAWRVTAWGRYHAPSFVGAHAWLLGAVSTVRHVPGAMQIVETAEFYSSEPHHGSHLLVQYWARDAAVAAQLLVKFGSFLGLSIG